MFYFEIQAECNETFYLYKNNDIDLHDTLEKLLVNKSADIKRRHPFIRFRIKQTPLLLEPFLPNGLPYISILQWYAMELGIQDTSDDAIRMERNIVSHLAGLYWRQLSKRERFLFADKYGFKLEGIQSAESFFVYHNYLAGVELAIKYIDNFKVPQSWFSAPSITRIHISPHAFTFYMMGLTVRYLNSPLKERLKLFLEYQKIKHNQQ